MALTAKQNMFVKEYLVDLNATRAAKAAGYSEKTAEVIGHENLRKPNIASAIQEAMDKRAEKVSVTVENVLKDILDTRACVEGAMADISYMRPADIAALVNARDKTNDMLMKHLGAYTNKVELEVTKMPEIKLTK